jgi:hypothetical protein
MKEKVAEFVLNSPLNTVKELNNLHIWNQPLVGVASANDSLWERLKEPDAVGPQHVLGQRAVEALTKHNFSAYYFKDRKEAVDQIMQLIPPGATVGLGGSRTGMELGLWELLAGRGHELFNHNQEGLTPEARVEKRYI